MFLTLSPKIEIWKKKKTELDDYTVSSSGLWEQSSYRSWHQTEFSETNTGSDSVGIQGRNLSRAYTQIHKQLNNTCK